MFDVVVVGSANVDLVVNSDRIPAPGETLIGLSYAEYPGGKGLNQAVAAARCGARVAFVGAVGDDTAGHQLRGVADHAGVDTASTSTIAGVSTGRALITVADDGENTIVVVPGANGAVDGLHPPEATVALGQLEVPLSAVIAVFRDARSRGAITVLNPAPATPLPDALIALTDIIVPNQHEIDRIGGVVSLLSRGVSTVIVTKGSFGVEVTTTRDGQTVVFSRPAIDVDAVDTTGAGDAFCGALAARLAAGAELEDAIDWANVAGGLATTRQGAVPSLPSAQEIQDVLTAQHERD